MHTKCRFHHDICRHNISWRGGGVAQFEVDDNQSHNIMTAVDLDDDEELRIWKVSNNRKDGSNDGMTNLAEENLHEWKKEEKEQGQ